MAKEVRSGSFIVTTTHIVAVVVALTGTVSFLFFALQEAQSRELEAARADTEYYRKALENAVQTALDTANYYRDRDGLPPIIPPPAVIPLSQSPSTENQRIAAELQTAMALLEQIKREVGLPPSPTPPNAIE